MISFIFWHLPGPYAWALRSGAGHALEHACFLLGAYGFWAVVMARGPRAPGAGAGIAFVATAALLIPPVHIYYQVKGAYRLRGWSALLRTSILLVCITVILPIFLLLLLGLGLTG